MKKKSFLTILVLGNSPRFRQLRVSPALVVALAALGTLLVAGGLAAPGLWLQVRTQQLSIERLRHENGQLWGEKDYFDGALGQIADRLDAYETQASRIADQLGLDPPLAEASGGGGDTSPRRFLFEGEVRYLQGRTETLDSSLETLDDAFHDRLTELAATPDGLPTEGWFSHGFGWRKDPFTGEREFHRGIDIVADAGTEVRATADGVISRSGRYPDYGLSVDIMHGHGFVTRYAHMRELLVRPGGRVRRGDIIGRVGSTGRSTGPHVHYEVFRDGRRVNPWIYLGQGNG